MKKFNIKEIRKMWRLNLVDGYTRAEYELKKIGVKATHKKKMVLAKRFGHSPNSFSRKMSGFAKTLNRHENEITKS